MQQLRIAELVQLVSVGRVAHGGGLHAVYSDGVVIGHGGITPGR